jgi:pimeloyl-ACP methyl ester carboxylesterase
MRRTMSFRRPALAALAACALSAAAAPAALAAPRLHWSRCGRAAHVVCTRVAVPADYDAPGGARYSLFVARSPATEKARRIGSLFINFGGPGGTTADEFEAEGAKLFPRLNRRFDIVAMDPRGVGQSRPAIDCKVDQETRGIYAEPFTRPASVDVDALLARARAYVDRCVQLDGDVLRHVSTANVARDIDLLRRALGERRITYFGYSYGTLLGATYARLFPRHYRAMVLDGPVDADAYINRPQRDLAAQTTSFEQSFKRFLAANGRSMGDVNRLLRRLDAHPLPVRGGRTLDGDDARAGISIALYNRGDWPTLDFALAAARDGSPRVLRALADIFYGRRRDGTYDPAGDRYFTIGATEQRYTDALGPYLREGRRSFARHPHFWFNNGYDEIAYRGYPARDADAFAGPWRLPRSAPKPLLVATTHDPATPYPGARRLARELHRARLLTMRGDGHTAYPGNSRCIDRAVERYVTRQALPRRGTTCRQAVPATASAVPRLPQRPLR